MSFSIPLMDSSGTAFPFNTRMGVKDDLFLLIKIRFELYSYMLEKKVTDGVRCVKID